jgi:hypothetical protein
VLSAKNVAIGLLIAEQFPLVQRVIDPHRQNHTVPTMMRAKVSSLTAARASFLSFDQNTNALQIVWKASEKQKAITKG